MSEMTLDEQREWWNVSAKINAMNAILSDRQEWNEDDFFLTGDAWVREHADFATANGVDLRGDLAVDFGCGIGRMTRAWASRYDRVVGLDVSVEMIERAIELNNNNRIEFRISDFPLKISDKSADLVYSTIVVQHISPPLNIEFVGEFFRISQSYVMFDAPSAQGASSELGTGMFLLPKAEIMEAADHAGFTLIACQDTDIGYEHSQYIFKRTK